MNHNLSSAPNLMSVSNSTSATCHPSHNSHMTMSSSVSVPPPLPSSLSSYHSTSTSTSAAAPPPSTSSSSSSTSTSNLTSTSFQEEALLQNHRAMIAALLDALQTTVFTKKKESIDNYYSYFLNSHPHFTRNDALMLLFGTHILPTSTSASSPMANAATIPHSTVITTSPNAIGMSQNIVSSSAPTAPSSASFAAPSNNLHNHHQQNSGLYSKLDKGILAASGQLSWKNQKLRASASKALTLVAALLDTRINPDAPLFHQIILESDYSLIRLMRLPRHLLATSENSGNLTAALKILECIKELRADLLEMLLNDKEVYHPTKSSSSASTSPSSTLTVSTTLPPPIISANRSPKHNQITSKHPRLPSTSGNFLTEPHSPMTSSPRAAEDNHDWKSKLRAHLTSFFASRPAREQLEQQGVLKPAQLFGLPFSKLNELGQIDPQTNVPRFMQSAIVYLSQPAIISLPGLFRLSGDSREITAMKQALDSGEKIDFTSQSSPHSVSGLLKMFLRDMPEPLLSYNLYEPLLEAFRHKLDIVHIEAILSSLSVYERSSMNALFEFLARVAEQSSVNLMGAPNLSICFSPNILRPRVETLQSVQKDSPAVIGLVAQLITSRMTTSASTASTSSSSLSAHDSNSEDVVAGISSSSTLNVNEEKMEVNKVKWPSRAPPPLPMPSFPSPPSLHHHVQPPPLPNVYSVISPPRSPSAATLHHHHPPPLPTHVIHLVKNNDEEVKEDEVVTSL